MGVCGIVALDRRSRQLARPRYEWREGREARRLGLSFNELRQAQIWAGDSAEGLGGMVGNVNKLLVDYQLGAGGAVRDFKALADASGGDALAIQAEGFKGVVQALEGVKDPALRAAMAYRFLGQNATDVLDQLNRPGGMAGAGNLMGRFGLGVNNVF